MSKMIDECVVENTVTDRDLLQTFCLEPYVDFTPLFKYVDYVVSRYEDFEDFIGDQKYCYAELISIAICFPHLIDYIERDSEGNIYNIYAPFDQMCISYWLANNIDADVEVIQEEYDVSYEEAEEIVTFNRAVGDEVIRHAKRFYDKIEDTDIYDEIIDICMEIMTKNKRI